VDRRQLGFPQPQAWRPGRDPMGSTFVLVSSVS
jgi:hypothetical protein